MSIFRSTQSDKKGASIEAPGTLDTSRGFDFRVEIIPSDLMDEEVTFVAFDGLAKRS